MIIEQEKYQFAKPIEIDPRKCYSVIQTHDLGDSQIKRRDCSSQSILS
jgi:hypothetical protein